MKKEEIEKQRRRFLGHFQTTTKFRPFARIKQLRIPQKGVWPPRKQMQILYLLFMLPNKLLNSPLKMLPHSYLKAIFCSCSFRGGRLLSEIHLPRASKAGCIGFRSGQWEALSYVLYLHFLLCPIFQQSYVGSNSRP